MRTAAIVGLVALVWLGGACAPAPAGAPRAGAPAGARAAAPASGGAGEPAPVGEAAPVAVAPTAPAVPRALTRVVQALPTRDLGFLPTVAPLVQGFFAEEGLAVEQVVMPSNASIPAITTKGIQLASAGSGVRAAYQGAPLRAIFYEYPRTNFIAVGSSEVKSYRDLPGKNLAVASPGGNEDFAVKRLLRHEGILLTDVQILPMGPSTQRAQAMLAGQVHFTVTNPDIAVLIERQGGNILGRLADIMPVLWAGFVMHQDVLREQPELARAWVRASVRGLLWVKQNPATAAEIGVRELQLEPEVARQALDLLLPVISEDDPGGWTDAGLAFTTQLDLEALGQEGDPVELGQRVHDITLLRQAQRELGIYCRQGAGC
jgi:ABC-type nitrate/sulfonate/bicarbonate transport system substrate-binding protein